MASTQPQPGVYVPQLSPPFPSPTLPYTSRLYGVRTQVLCAHKRPCCQVRNNEQAVEEAFMPASDSYAIMRHLFTMGFADSEERMLEGTERCGLLIQVCYKRQHT